ncbi:hypothetical protein MKS88_002640 [Plasmodium brasilianum]|uniref:Uncharacterized protein n=1 Tax=Plasmodium brasilianum TaxID=5824 RepID=A0ACB9Y9Q3_PLABR|nr:hypothetical protein MKS88_002640 [Plasmodium brasilianum]
MFQNISINKKNNNNICKTLKFIKSLQLILNLKSYLRARMAEWSKASDSRSDERKFAWSNPGHLLGRQVSWPLDY